MASNGEDGEGGQRSAQRQLGLPRQFPQQAAFDGGHFRFQLETGHFILIRRGDSIEESITMLISLPAAAAAAATTVGNHAPPPPLLITSDFGENYRGTCACKQKINKEHKCLSWMNFRMALDDTGRAYHITIPTAFLPVRIAAPSLQLGATTRAEDHAMATTTNAVTTSTSAAGTPPRLSTNTSTQVRLSISRCGASTARSGSDFNLTARVPAANTSRLHSRPKATASGAAVNALPSARVSHISRPARQSASTSLRARQVAMADEAAADTPPTDNIASASTRCTRDQDRGQDSRTATRSGSTSPGNKRRTSPNVADGQEFSRLGDGRAPPLEHGLHFGVDVRAHLDLNYSEHVAGYLQALFVMAAACVLTVYLLT